MGAAHPLALRRDRVEHVVVVVGVGAGSLLAPSLTAFAHSIADLNRAVAQRRRELARVIHNFGLLTTELGRRDSQLERFVTSSKDVLGNFGNQHDAIEELLVELPATLKALESAMRSSDSLGT